ncbi:Hypothetical protein A7982_07949 [Minicystis rosea]|nr:Hypothetical protein A7982_07949 [Minicystis rosea]
MAREREPRRTFLIAAGLTGAGTLLMASANAAAGPAKVAGPRRAEEEVSPVEDLMREHGVLRRVLLVYDELVRRIEGRHPFPFEVLGAAAGIIRRFIEDYHEKLEEELVFPRFEKAGQLVDLVSVLRRQHKAGRRVTDVIVASASPTAAHRADVGITLVNALEAFARMYRPHAAREDTVLFPELRPLVGAKEYDALGETFEEKEHELFGPKGFEGVVAEVAQLEEALGIHDLAKLTPT